METWMFIVGFVFLLLIGPILACCCSRHTDKAVKAALDSAAEYRLLEAKNLVPNLISDLECAETLLEMLALHKLIWALGLRNKNLGPDRYGMFRTSDILSMVPDEVYLGNFSGYFTHPIPVWEEGRAGNEELYQEILSQYRKHLISNLNAIAA